MFSKNRCFVLLLRFPSNLKKIHIKNNAAAWRATRALARWVHPGWIRKNSGIQLQVEHLVFFGAWWRCFGLFATILIECHDNFERLIGVIDDTHEIHVVSMN